MANETDTAHETPHETAQDVVSPTSSGTTELAERPYHSKRPHTKSRRGCLTCKKRKVKCDEARPRCRPCTLRQVECLYAAPSTRASGSGTSSAARGSTSAATVATQARSSAVAPHSSASARVPDFNLVFQPIYTPSQVDSVEMMLLWFYTTKGFETFSVNAGQQGLVDKILRVDIPQAAFASPFLMNCLLGLSAMHLRREGRSDISHSRTVANRAKAFEGYRHAIEEADPRQFPAILACSMLLCPLASQMFRDPDAKPLYILDWMMIWRGIALVVELIRPQVLFKTGMAVLFARPPIDVPDGIPRLPDNLLSMISSIPETDEDYPYIGVYNATLRLLSTLYLDLENDFNPILDLRIVSFFTFLPQKFVDLARQKRPRALIIIAHYLPFTKLIFHNIWWMDGIAEKEILDVYNHVGAEWYEQLKVPLAARRLKDKVEVARLLLEDPEWQTAGDDKYHVKRDERAKALHFIDDQGRKADFKGNWIIEDEAPTDARPVFAGRSL